MKFAFTSAVYYWFVWVLYKVSALYVGWVSPAFMAGWYDTNHAVVRAIPNYGWKFDNIVRDNFADGSLVFWELWIIVGILLTLIRKLRRKS